MAPSATELRFDHVVIAVPDLERAMADYEALGFTVRFGGEHPGRRTHNALITFTDGSYFELIAERPDLPPTADRRENWIREVVARQGSTLLTYALRTDDLNGMIETCRKRGLILDGPHDGQRLRPDGNRIAWRSASPPSGSGLPFLIEDKTPREWRISREKADTTHANGALEITNMLFHYADIDINGTKISKMLEQLLGRPYHEQDGMKKFELADMDTLFYQQLDENDAMDENEMAPITPTRLTLLGERDLGELDYDLRGMKTLLFIFSMDDIP